MPGFELDGRAVAPSFAANGFARDLEVAAIRRASDLSLPSAPVAPEATFVSVPLLAREAASEEKASIAAAAQAAEAQAVAQQQKALLASQYRGGAAPVAAPARAY